VVGVGEREPHRLVCVRVSSRKKYAGIFFIGKCEQNPSSFRGGVFGIYLKQPTDLIDCDLDVSFDEGV
jgi:hypothetical protein